MNISRIQAFLVTLFLCASIGLSQSAEATITNTDIIQMVKDGFSSELINAKIKASKVQFDTSPAQLTELKKNGVPESVLLAMVQSSAPAPVETKIKSEVPSAQQTAENDAAKRAIKALRKLSSSTNVGVSLVNYNPLVAEAKTEVEDALQYIQNPPLRTAIKSSLAEYEFAASVWQATWRGDFIEGDLRKLAINNYGVPKKGLLKVVWRNDFLAAIWQRGSGYFNTANQLLNNDERLKKNDDPFIGKWKLVIDYKGKPEEIQMEVIKNSFDYLAVIEVETVKIPEILITKIGNTFIVKTAQQNMTLEIKGNIVENELRGTITFKEGDDIKSGAFVAKKL